MSEIANQTEKKTEFGWSDVDESPVISTVVPTQEPPTVDLSASVSNLKEEPESEQKTHDVSAAESSEEKVELNQEMIEALLNKLMEFDDMPPLVDDEIPELVYSSDDSCPRCDAALKVLLSNRRHPVINVESDSDESEDSEESQESQESEESQDSEDSQDSDSDYIPSDSDSDSDSDPPTPRTLAHRQVNVPSAIQYITVILALVYLFKFYFFMNESRIRYRPCT